jgi:hypothetical protein
MTQSTDSTGQRMIWDLPTRVFHWGLAGRSWARTS